MDVHLIPYSVYNDGCKKMAEISMLLLNTFPALFGSSASGLDAVSMYLLIFNNLLLFKYVQSPLNLDVTFTFLNVH